MVGVINQPKVFTDKKKLIETATTYITDEKVRNSCKYDSDFIIKGITNESRIIQLLNFIDGVIKVWKIEDGTVLEAVAKVDIVFELNNQLLGIQVKSSETGALVHNGKSDIGVIWVGESSNIQILNELMQWLDRRLKQEIKDVIILSRKMKGKTILLKLLNLSELQLTAIKMLNLGKIFEGYIRF